MSRRPIVLTKPSRRLCEFLGATALGVKHVAAWELRRIQREAAGRVIFILDDRGSYWAWRVHEIVAHERGLS